MVLDTETGNGALDDATRVLSRWGLWSGDLEDVHLALHLDLHKSVSMFLALLKLESRIGKPRCEMRSLVLKTRWMRTQDSDCDMLEEYRSGLQPWEIVWFPKTQADGLGWYDHAPSVLASDCM